MAFKVETVILSPDTDQYAGHGQDVQSIPAIAEVARKMEELGFDGVTTPEAGHDPFLPLPLVAEHTKHVEIGTNVAIAFPRSPMVTAQIAWDLQQLTQGRFRLGLGSQVKGHIERRYAADWTGPPGPRMREYLQCMRAIFETFKNGMEPNFFEGEHYQFTMMNPFFNPGPIEYPDPPLLIAAVNTYMAGLAGEMCDGLRLHPIATFAFTRDVVLPAVRKGAEKAGRDPSQVELVGAPFLAIAKNETGVFRAMQALKQHIAFYASTRTYHSVLEYHGWLDVGAELHRLSKEGKWTEMPNCISDEMLQEWAIICTWDQLADRCRERCSGIFDTLLLDLPADARRDDEFVRETVQQLRQD